MDPKSPCGVLIDESLQDSGELLLLTAGKLRSSLKKVSHLAVRTCSPSLPSVGVVLTAE
jgi:hypothetical protein